MNFQEVATKQYNWKGQVVAYQQQNMWIPAGVDSHYSREIEERINNGMCTLVEPEINLVYDIYGEDGKWRGYLWNDLFVPNDESNQLFLLIKKRITDNSCQVEQLPKTQLFEGKIVKELIVGMYFDSQWLSIKDEIYANIHYSYGHSSDYSYNVRFKNMYCHRSTSIEEVIKNEYGLTCFSFPFENGVPRGSFLEITLPVDRLGKIFKLFRQKMRKANFDLFHLDDKFSMHMAQTGRSSKRGPTNDWLIIHLHEYLDDIILDVGNRALDFISYSGYSYEDQNIKHITQRMIHTRNYILRKYCDNTFEYHKMSFFCDSRYYFADENRTVLNNERHEDIVNETDMLRANMVKYKELPLKKIRVMLEVGLTLEALCILNGYLEVVYKLALRSTFPDDTMKVEIRKLWHRETLDIVKLINSKANFNSYNIEAGKKYLEAANEIYSYRNDYLHALKLPETSVFMTNLTRLKLEALMKPFVQPFESHQFLIHIDGYRVNKQAQKIIYEEVKKIEEKLALRKKFTWIV